MSVTRANFAESMLQITTDIHIAPAPLTAGTLHPALPAMRGEGHETPALPAPENSEGQRCNAARHAARTASTSRLPSTFR